MSSNYVFIPNPSICTSNESTSNSTGTHSGTNYGVTWPRNEDSNAEAAGDTSGVETASRRLLNGSSPAELGEKEVRHILTSGKAYDRETYTNAVKKAEELFPSMAYVHKGVKSREHLTYELWTMLDAFIEGEGAKAIRAGTRPWIAWRAFVEETGYGLVACRDASALDWVRTATKACKMDGQCFRAWMKGERELRPINFYVPNPNAIKRNWIMPMLLEANKLRGRYEFWSSAGVSNEDTKVTGTLYEAGVDDAILEKIKSLGCCLRLGLREVDIQLIFTEKNWPKVENAAMPSPIRSKPSTSAGPPQPPKSSTKRAQSAGHSQEPPTKLIKKETEEAVAPVGCMDVAEFWGLSKSRKRALRKKIKNMLGKVPPSAIPNPRRDSPD